MTDPVRIAIRKFGPFEAAIAKQFDDFVRSTGTDARLEIEALDLNPMHERLFARRELATGAFDIAFMSTDWIAEAQNAGLVADLKPHMRREPIPDFPEAWTRSLLELQEFDEGFWGIPYHDGPQCLIYRKDLLRRGGPGSRRRPGTASWRRRENSMRPNVAGTAR